MAYKQFRRVQKFVLGTGEAGVWGCAPRGYAGGRVPAEGLWAMSPRSCGINAFRAIVVFVNTKM